MRQLGEFLPPGLCSDFGTNTFQSIPWPRGFKFTQFNSITTKSSTTYIYQNIDQKNRLTTSISSHRILVCGGTPPFISDVLFCWFPTGFWGSFFAEWTWTFFFFFFFFFFEMLSQISNVNTPKRFGENVHDFNQFSSDLGLFRRLIITMYWPR